MSPSSTHRIRVFSRWFLPCALLCYLSFGCTEFAGPPPPSAEDLRFPGAIQADRDGLYLYVVKTNFDLNAAGGAIVAIDLTTHQIVENSGIAIDSFPGMLALRHTDTHSTSGYITSRSTNDLTWFTIERGEKGEPLLRCGNPEEDGLTYCDDAHRFADGLAVEDDTPLTVGKMPFGTTIRHGQDDKPDLLFTGALFDGVLGTWILGENGEPQLVDNHTLVGGLYGMATSAATGLVYVASQFTNGFYALEIAQGILPTGSAFSSLDPTEDSPVVGLDLEPVFNSGEISGRTFGQGMAFNQDGTLGFLAYRNPPSVVVFSATLDAFDEPQHDVLALIDVDASPAEIAIVPRADGLGERVYVSCFGSNKIQVIDTRVMAVVDTIEAGQGPFDIEIVHNEDLGFHRAYVSLFEEHAIAVIDLDETSPYFHDVIARIH